MVFDINHILSRLALREKIENFPRGVVREWILNHIEQSRSGTFTSNGVRIVIDRFGVKVPPVDKWSRKAYPKVARIVDENLNKPIHFSYKVSIVDNPYIATAALVSADTFENATQQVMDAVSYVFKYGAEPERPAPVRGEIIQKQLAFNF